jgi:hypothetical protein
MESEKKITQIPPDIAIWQEGEQLPDVTPEEFTRLVRLGPLHINSRGQIRPTRRDDSDPGVSLRKRRAWYEKGESMRIGTISKTAACAIGFAAFSLMGMFAANLSLGVSLFLILTGFTCLWQLMFFPEKIIRSRDKS